MKFTIKSEKPETVKSGCVILGVFEHRKLSPAAAQFDRSTKGLLKKLLQKGDMDGKCGQTLMLHYPAGANCERVLLAGCGKAEDFNSRAFNKVIAGVTSAVNQSGASDAVNYLGEL
ncbi:MAG: leucyl aminopeptidase, partial [Gammaproteobacteria bacterium]|nr:leucyl aminopeptidase [Gammaproteobacteria bacterium]